MDFGLVSATGCGGTLAGKGSVGVTTVEANGEFEVVVSLATTTGAATTGPTTRGAGGVCGATGAAATLAPPCEGYGTAWAEASTVATAVLELTAAAPSAAGTATDEPDELVEPVLAGSEVPAEADATEVAGKVPAEPVPCAKTVGLVPTMTIWPDAPGAAVLPDPP